MLNTYTMVTNINHWFPMTKWIIHHYPSIVCMPVNIGTKSLKTIWVKRYMAKDHSIHYMVCSKFPKILIIFFISKNIVVTADKNFITIKSFKNRKTSSVNNHITKMVNFISRFYSFVPTSDHFLIHLFRAIPRTEL